MKEIAATGLQLAPQQQQEAAIAALAADVQQLAAQVVRSTAATIAALRLKLQSSMPRISSPAGQWRLGEAGRSHLGRDACMPAQPWRGARTPIAGVCLLSP